MCSYVTRQGQGGRQATQDKSGKFAKSMGSQLRRHNEAALERDVSETLAAWAHELRGCHLLFVHASAANAKAVFGAGGIGRDDTRVRRIPFTTGRPTLRELKRVVMRLADVEPVEDPATQQAAAAQKVDRQAEAAKAPAAAAKVSIAAPRAIVLSTAANVV